MSTESRLSRYIEKKAAALNERASQIDSSLFFFCNYEDGGLPVFGHHERMVHAFIELYKFSVDCFPLNSLFDNPKQKFDCLNDHFKSLPERLRDDCVKAYGNIQSFRSFYVHPNSEKNGGIQSRNINEFRALYVRVTGHEYDDVDLRDEDFQPAYAAAVQCAEHVVCAVQEFAEYVDGLSEECRSEAIEAWRTRILHWYSNNTKKDYLRGYVAPNIPYGWFKNYQVHLRGPYCRSLREHIKWIIKRNQEIIVRLEGESSAAALDEFQSTYEASVATSEEAGTRLQMVNDRLSDLYDQLPDRNYGEIFLSEPCQTALFAATRALYPTCSLLPQEFYDYVVFKLLALR